MSCVRTLDSFNQGLPVVSSVGRSAIMRPFLGYSQRIMKSFILAGTYFFVAVVQLRNAHNARKILNVKSPTVKR